MAIEIPPRFEPAFREALQAAGTGTASIENLLTDVATRYSGRGRHYHNLKHLDNLLSELMPLKPLVNDWPSIVFAMNYLH